MNTEMSLEDMLFGLKEVVKDTDAFEIKNEIDQRLTHLADSHDVGDTQKDVEFVKDTVAAVTESFEKRREQMLTDTEIVRKINMKIDDFRTEHQIKVEGLLSSLMQDIDKAIDKYANEIVKRLDPLVIKERFKKKDDFELWLNTLNDSYKDAMEKTVDRKTQSTIRSYLVDVEDVFETASSYLADRNTLISVEDTFYGTLASSKNIITRDIRNNINELTVYNKSLYEASEDLFNNIWEARKKYDAKRHATTAGATVTGATGVAVGAAYLIGSSAAASAGVSLSAGSLISVGMSALTASALPIIAGISVLAISGIVIAKTASKLSSALYSGGLEKNVNACIEEFTGEINKSKFAMKSHISESIKLIFDNELKSLDRTFLEFRKATYIDEDKIPKLADKIQEIESEVGIA